MVVYIFKVIIYVVFGNLILFYLGYGIFIGVVVYLGNRLGYLVLEKISF